LNIRNSNTPIPVSCLEEMHIDYLDFAKNILKLFTDEFDDILEASYKVNWVK